MTKEIQEAITLLQKASKANPEDTTIWHRLIGVLAKSGRFGECASTILRASTALPEWTQFHYELIGRLVDDGFGSQIGDAAKDLTVQEPDNSSAWYILGLACQAITEQRKAIAAYRSGLRKDPTNAAIYNNLGNALKITGDEKACIEYQLQAVACSSTIAEPHYVLGVLYMKAKKFDDARTQFEAFLQLGRPYLRNYLQEAKSSLDILGLLDNQPSKDAIAPVKRSRYWKCPKCGVVHKKSEIGLFAEKVIGTNTCICNATFSQSDVYGGKYDVEIMAENSCTSGEIRKKLDQTKRKWWKVWR